MIPLGWSITGICEISGAFGGGEVAEEIADAVPGGLDRAWVGFAQQDGIEIGRVVERIVFFFNTYDHGYAPYAGTPAPTVWYWCDPYQDITLRYPNARFRGKKLFSSPRAQFALQAADHKSWSWP
jgi:hypothetical protein